MFHLPTTFVPQPVKFAIDSTNSTIYYYLIQSANSKCAYVTILYSLDNAKGYGKVVKMWMYDHNSMILMIWISNHMLFNMW